MAADGKQERLGKFELMRNPGAKQRANETEANRNNQPAAGAAGDGLADGPADCRDEDVAQEGRDCHCHGTFLSPG